MAFPAVQPGGFGLQNPLTSAQANKLDTQHQLATDGRVNPDELPVLNLQRHVDQLGSNWEFYDVMWDPPSRQYAFVVQASGETAVVTAAELMSPMPTFAANITGGGIDWRGGWAAGADRIVLSEQQGGSGRIALIVDGLFGAASQASSPPGVDISAPVYAWDIDRYIVCADANAFYSDDGGDTWLSAGVPPSVANPFEPITDGTRTMVGSSNPSTIAYSYSDDGSTWVDQNLPDPVTSIRFAWLQRNGVWCAAGRVPSSNDVRTFVSQNGGATFTLQSEINMGGASIRRFGFVANLLLMALSDNRLMASADHGATYYQIGVSLHAGPATASNSVIWRASPFVPNMYLTFASDTVGLAAFQQDLITSMRNLF